MKKRKFLLKSLLALFSLGSIMMVLGVIVLAGVMSHYSSDLPNHEKLKAYKPPIMTRFYAGDGTLIAEYASEKRIFLPVYAMPTHVIYAFLSAEDKNFFSHKGVDFVGVLRAAVKNIDNVRNGRRLEGASTITQQVAKNFLLTNEVSFERKIKEALLAFKIEDTFSKQHILELYLNEIYLGNRSFGVAAAALNYFDKSLDELSIDEAALLAALPKAPSDFNPYRNPERAKIRRDWILSRMHEDGYITESQMELAQLQPISLERPERENFRRARYFSEEVRQELIERYGEDIIYLGGLSVRTTLDPELQEIAFQALRKGLENYDRRHGYRGPLQTIKDMKNWKAELADIEKPFEAKDEWDLAVVTGADWRALTLGFKDGRPVGKILLKDLGWARQTLDDGKVGGDVNSATKVGSVGDVILVERKQVEQGDDGKEDLSNRYVLRQIPKVQGAIIAMDPHTGRVLAMQGGYIGSISSFNRATQAKRQPGSAFKPFVYLAALDEGFTPSNLVLDAPFVIDQGPGLPKWRPQNYSNKFYGPTPLRVGIEKSKNLMTVRLANHIGMDKIASYAKRFGVDDNMKKTLAMALGAGETTLSDITSAYSVFVNGGKKISPTFIDRIQDRSGKTIYKSDKRPCPDCEEIKDWDDATAPNIIDNRPQIADPRTAYQITSMLEGVVQRGTGVRLRELDRPMGGKTGTTNDSKDAWFIGFTPDLIAGVYIGFDNPSPLGPGETGSSVALPVFKDFMKQALEDEPITPFRVPEGIELVKINSKTGTPAKAGDRNTIWEAFLPGTEPTQQQYMLDRSGLNLVRGNDPTSTKQSATFGTGGLY